MLRAISGQGSERIEFGVSGGSFSPAGTRYKTGLTGRYKSKDKSLGFDLFQSLVYWTEKKIVRLRGLCLPPLPWRVEVAVADEALEPVMRPEHIRALDSVSWHEHAEDWRKKVQRGDIGSCCTGDIFPRDFGAKPVTPARKHTSIVVRFVLGIFLGCSGM